MCEVGVIDTCVLIGFTVKIDQHHETTRDYIVDGELESIYLPPKANEEFQDVEPKVRRIISNEISDHRTDVIEQVDSTLLDNSGIRFIRDGILDENEQSRSHAFLYRYYTLHHEQSGKVKKQQIVKHLSDMETEVHEDKSKQYGGWESHVDVWIRGVDRYPELKKDLLLPDSNDLDILIEAHHIAAHQNPKRTEFATANPTDFVIKYDSEPISRKEDIKQKPKSIQLRTCRIHSSATSPIREF